MIWVTRERPKIDRIACPWLIRRFIETSAPFIYAPADRVMAIAEETAATPYDVAGVEFTYEGEGWVEAMDRSSAGYAVLQHAKDPISITLSTDQIDEKQRLVRLILFVRRS